MTESQKYLPFISRQKSVSLTQCGSFQSFDFTKTEFKNSDRKIIKFPIQKQKQELQKIQWRRRTQFPIVKIISFKKLNNQPSNNQKYLSKKILIQLILEPIPYTLADVDQIPIFKVFYLLKQTIIATERLCTIYGNFLVKSSMVGIDEKKRCKIWHNSKFHINKPQQPCKSQQKTVQSVVELFISKTKKSLKSIRFYQELQKCKTFCDCLILLKNFISYSKIRIPSNFSLIDQFSSNMCSPRKYISRPPSGEKNPESKENSIEKGEKLRKMRSPDLSSQRNMILSGVNTSRNKLTSIQKKQTPKISPYTFRKPAYSTLQQSRTKLTSQQQQKPSQSNKSNNILFIRQKKKTLCRIDSVFEDQSDSQCELMEPPCIRLIEPILSNESQNTKSSIFERSFTLDGENEVHEVYVDNFMAIGKILEKTTDQTITLAKSENGCKLFRPMIKLIDKSFDDNTYKE